MIESDDETSDLVVSTLAEIAALDLQLTELMDLSYVKDVEGIKIDPGAGVARLQNQGRRKIRVISDALDLKPMADYYSPPATHAASRWI